MRGGGGVVTGRKGQKQLEEQNKRGKTNTHDADDSKKLFVIHVYKNVSIVFFVFFRVQLKCVEKCVKNTENTKSDKKIEKKKKISPLRWYKLQQPTPLTDNNSNKAAAYRARSRIHTRRMRFGKTTKRVPSLCYHKYLSITRCQGREPSTQSTPFLALHLPPSCPNRALLSGTERTP